MSTARHPDQEGLARDIDRVRQTLVAGLRPSGVDVRPERSQPKALAQDSAPLRQLCEGFRLTSFERDVVLLAAGMELESDLPGVLRDAMGYEACQPLTFRAAIALLVHPHWSAVSPGSPLRRWNLIDTEPGISIMLSPLRLNERILDFLLGQTNIDERLGVFMSRAHPATAAVQSHEMLAKRVAARWMEDLEARMPAVVYLTGVDLSSMLAVATLTAELLDAELWSLPVSSLPEDPAKLELLIRLWERETILSRRLLLLRGEETRTEERSRGASRIIEHLGACLFVTGQRDGGGSRPSLTIEVARPTAEEQADLWRRELNHQSEAQSGAQSDALDDALARLTRQYDLSGNRIESAAAEARSLAEAAGGSGSALAEAVWLACRAQIRPELEGLAQRLDARGEWRDLVLPPAQTRLLEEIAIHLRNRFKVFGDWGFGAGQDRGKGLSALFSGPSGTGKTLAAEVLSRQMELPLYRIDLSSVVSKYIGETEKNLRKVFDAAEESGAVLLFDEADALFGKRSEVKDSHDRYANIEVSYLLQRIEKYRGLAILTTNTEESLDPAFQRRIAYVVRFPFPGPAERREIWRRMYPPGFPAGELNYDRLAQLSASGGTIRNMSLKAAMFAADAGEKVSMQHVLLAARSEHQKMARALSENEVRGWV